MKDLLKYIYSRRSCILWGLACTAIFGAVFALYGIDMRVIGYPLLLSKNNFCFFIISQHGLEINFGTEKIFSKNS